MRDESEKEVIHRLEAFSDIVIGFGLAQLSLSLTLPAHIRDLFVRSEHLSTLGTFAFTFALVCTLWWLHHRLFRHLFVPTNLAVVLNFAALGGILFYAYAMQVLLHVGMSDPDAVPLYTGCYAYITLLFSIIAWIGLRARGASMDRALREESTDFATRLSILAFGFSAIAIFAITVGPTEKVFVWTVWLLIGPLLVQRIFIRLRRRNDRSGAILD